MYAHIIFYLEIKCFFFLLICLSLTLFFVNINEWLYARFNGSFCRIYIVTIDYVLRNMCAIFFMHYVRGVVAQINSVNNAWATQTRPQVITRLDNQIHVVDSWRPHSRTTSYIYCQMERSFREKRFNSRERIPRPVCWNIHDVPQLRDKCKIRCIRRILCLLSRVTSGNREKNFPQKSVE